MTLTLVATPDGDDAPQTCAECGNDDALEDCPYCGDCLSLRWTM